MASKKIKQNSSSGAEAPAGPPPTGEAMREKILHGLTTFMSEQPARRAAEAAAEAKRQAELARPMTEADFRHWRKRTVADLVTLYKICPARRCRRACRCLVEDAPCLSIHRGKASDRLNLLLGWAEGHLLEEDDQLTW